MLFSAWAACFGARRVIPGAFRPQGEAQLEMFGIGRTDFLRCLVQREFRKLARLAPIGALRAGVQATPGVANSIAPSAIVTISGILTGVTVVRVFARHLTCLQPPLSVQANIVWVFTVFTNRTKAISSQRFLGTVEAKCG